MKPAKEIDCSEAEERAANRDEKARETEIEASRKGNCGKKEQYEENENVEEKREKYPEAEPAPVIRRWKRC